jgi:hypothetical protein
VRIVSTNIASNNRIIRRITLAVPGWERHPKSTHIADKGTGILKTGDGPSHRPDDQAQMATDFETQIHEPTDRDQSKEVSGLV